MTDLLSVRRQDHLRPGLLALLLQQLVVVLVSLCFKPAQLLDKVLPDVVGGDDLGSNESHQDDGQPTMQIVAQILPFNLGSLLLLDQVNYTRGGAEDQNGGGQVVLEAEALVEEAERVEQVDEYVWADVGP